MVVIYHLAFVILKMRKKTTLKKTPWAIFALFLFLLIIPPFTLNCLAQTAPPPTNAALQGLINTAQQAKIETGSAPNIYQIVGYIINIILGFLGVIFLVLVIYGGFLWMTAGGNEDKVKKGRELLTHAAIGLAIVLAAFLLTNFVVFKLIMGTQNIMVTPNQ